MSKGERLQTYHGKVVRLLVMPDDGIESVRRLVAGAAHSLRLKMFEFQSMDLVADIVAAKARGVDVQVLLNPVRSSGLQPNNAAKAALEAAGVDVHWTNPAFAITHEKSLVIDRRLVLVATFNFADKYFTATRDYGLLLDDEALAAQITACFDADRARTPFAPPPATPLAWGNQNARHAHADLIDATKHHLWIQHPKFHDAAMLDRVLAARERGVHVRLLCGGRHGIEDFNLTETFSYQRILARAGVHVRKQSHPKLHAKLVLGDETRAMVGSMNIDRDAYDVRRELGLTFDDAEAVAALKARFEADWEAAKPYEAPDPLSLDLHASPEVLDRGSPADEPLHAIVHD